MLFRSMRVCSSTRTDASPRKPSCNGERCPPLSVSYLSHTHTHMPVAHTPTRLNIHTHTHMQHKCIQGPCTHSLTRAVNTNTHTGKERTNTLHTCEGSRYVGVDERERDTETETERQREREKERKRERETERQRDRGKRKREEGQRELMRSSTSAQHLR